MFGVLFNESVFWKESKTPKQNEKIQLQYNAVDRKKEKRHMRNCGFFAIRLKTKEMYLMSTINEVESESVIAIQNPSPIRNITKEFCRHRWFFLRLPVNKYFSVHPLSSLLRVVPENCAFFSKY